MIHKKQLIVVWARAAGLLSLFLWVILAGSGCSRNQMQVVSARGETMGTFYNVKVVAAERELPTEAQLEQWADEVFARINNSMSTYLDSSELMRLNNSQVQDWQEVSTELFMILDLSQRISELSAGSFDVTIGPLVDLWGFGPVKRPNRVPDEGELQQTLARIGHGKLELNPATSSVRKPAELRIDLSAIAKGYAADELANTLVSKGYPNVLVEIGGELSLRGISQRGTPWRIGIEAPSFNPLNVDSHAARTVVLSDKGMATSGDYRNYYEVDGKRFSHTIDPRTGRPIVHNLASVTVLAETCAEADALATALNVLGSDEGLALANRENIAAYFIVREGDGFVTKQSDQFAQYTAP